MISVIIPLYNKEKSVLNCVNSVLNQSYKNFELIVVNDGSTDGSSEIISKIHDFRIQFFTIQNQGVSNARNYGAAKSKFDYLFFLDADDTIDKHTLKNFFELLSSAKEVNFFVSNFFVKSDDISFPGSLLINSKAVKSMYKYKSLNLVVPRIGCYIINKNLFNELGGFDEQLSRFEDTALLLKIFKKINYYLYSPFFSVTYNVDFQDLSKIKNCSRDYSMKCKIQKSDNFFEKLIKYQMKYDSIQRFSNEPIKHNKIVKHKYIFICFMIFFNFFLRFFKKLYIFFNSKLKHNYFKNYYSLLLIITLHNAYFVTL